MKKTSRSLISALLVLVMIVSSFVGTTYAWFTDSVSSVNNIIKAGNLDVEMYWTDDLGSQAWVNVEDDDAEPLFNYDNWEPGYTEVRYVKIANAGSLAFKYMMNIIPTGEVGILADVIDVSFDIVTDNTSFEAPERSKMGSLKNVGSLRDVIEKNGIVAQGVLLPDGEEKAGFYDGEVIVCVSLHMQESAGNKYQNQSVGDAFDVQIIATQYDYENDSFGNGYDTDAEWPDNPINNGGVSVSADVETDANGIMTENATLVSDDGSVVVDIPAGTKLKPGVDKVTMTVTPKEESEANIVVKNDTEVIKSYDIHLEGVAEDNTVPAKTYLPEFMPQGLNEGNYSLYHVENGSTNQMSEDNGGQHNGFVYEPANGDLCLYLKGYSEIALVSDTKNAWNGNFDYSWYTNAVAPVDGETVTEYVISNADQLAGFGAIVGGMAEGIERDSFAGKTVTLTADINLGYGVEGHEYKTFYPIGYYNSTGSYEKTSGGSVTSSVSSFKGTFDGNGHTIANFYQNTWEMFGDYNSGYSGTPNHYKDAMGLFGYVVNGTVKNLTVDNFSSDGEYTPTGVIAAYAVDSTFENIAITNCNPRVYNTGNGGIVGIGGNSDDPDTYKLTFNNITIDNSNKITALWGSWDVACGGLVGMFRGAGHAHMTNCHVAAQIDVYNDVCGNYQYYWYRYSGMMIGTNKNMTTDANGYTVPETDKFHAENCTVHFGNWNDYYYCELVANSLASYTHDHQFSRLEQISSLDEIKSGDTWTKTGNFLLIAGETKTCYHIVKNADGTLKQHLHTDAGEETVNGETVLKENNQIVYLPFNQLFTGYGWGVKHVPVYNGEDYAFEGITILDREVADSVNKFKPVINAEAELSTETTVTVGDLFEAIENAGVDIKGDNVQVTVSPFGAESTAGGTYVANTTDWKQGTLTFSGMGAAVITITDYYFCKTATVNVKIVAVDKFDTKFVNHKDYLYRVGNADKNTVALGTIFKAKGGVTIDSSTVKVDFGTIKGDASGTFANNATDWTKGTIQFSGTGVVKVTVKAAGANEFVLYLEVVDAYNATSAVSAPYTYNGVKYSVVLLNDVTNGGFTTDTGYGFYGNGFTITLNPNNHTLKKGNGYAGYIHMRGGVIDNVRIEGPVFAESYIYQSQGLPAGTSNTDSIVNYFRNAICIDSGDAVITNSYISGARTAICVKAGGNVTIENSRIAGGAYANIEVISADSLTLKNVVTEQKETIDSYGKNKQVIGTGIVINNSDTTLTLNGLTQYNWMNKSQWDGMLGEYKSAFPKLFDADHTSIQYTYNNTTYVNTGIIWACDMSEKPSVKGTISGYDYISVTLGTKSGYVYTMTKGSGASGVLSADNVIAPEYKATAQGAVPPTPSFDYTSKNNEPEQSGSNDYCYYKSDSGKFLISFDQGESKNWYSDILTVSKGKSTLPYTVSVSGTAVVNADKTITFKDAGDYVVTYTYTDNGNYKLDNGEIETYSKTYYQYVRVTVFVVEPQADPTVFAFGKNYNDGYRIVSAGGITYVMPDVSSTKDPVKTNNVITTSGIGSKTIDGQTIYYPIISQHKVGASSSYYNYFSVFEAVTITDANGNKYDVGSSEMPSNLQVIGGFIIDENGNVGTESANGTAMFNYSTGKTIKTKTVTDKDGNNFGLCYYPDSGFSSSTSERPKQTIVVKYCYTDSLGKAYYYYIGYLCEKGSTGRVDAESCVTGDTLVTLADGTQKRIDEVTYSDMLLVWDFYTGTYSVAPASIIWNHGDAEYNVLTLKFSDGTEVRTINSHGFFDVGENNFVYITENNVESYLGHSFVKASGETYEEVQLIGYTVTVEYVGCYSIQTAVHNNFIVENMFSMTTPDYEGWFDYFDITDDMMYDEEHMQAEIDKYGLCSYEEISYLGSYDLYVALNARYLKILIGRGVVTMEQVVDMLAKVQQNN